MNHTLQKLVSDFIDARWDKHHGVLLAYSGGPDSLALLHLLLSYSKNHPIKIALAHVDHGWRIESKQEAIQIAEMARQLGVTLHTTSLDPKHMEGNLEAACRDARLRFFSDLCSTHEYQAVLMAHHADDLAETVLKRVLEGSSLSYLSGLSPCSVMDGMIVWRPLLPVSKKTLLHWLESCSLKGFEDQTNYDPRFLRARLRTKIIPELSKDFGKEVSSGLCHIGLEAAELREYLDKKIAPYLNRIVVGPFGALLDLSNDCPEPLIELKYLIRRCCEVNYITLSRENVKFIAHALKENLANKQVLTGDHQLYIDRGKLFITTHHKCLINTKEMVLCENEGEFTFGPWTIKTSSIEMANGPPSNWRSLWQGEGEVILPLNKYTLSLPELNDLYPGESLISKWWSNHKIPAFFRQCAPVVYQNRRLVHEFLTGKMGTKSMLKPKEYLRIKLFIS